MSNDKSIRLNNRLFFLLQVIFSKNSKNKSWSTRAQTVPFWSGIGMLPYRNRNDSSPHRHQPTGDCPGTIPYTQSYTDVLWNFVPSSVSEQTMPIHRPTHLLCHAMHTAVFLCVRNRSNLWELPWNLWSWLHSNCIWLQVPGCARLLETTQKTSSNQLK